MKASWGVWSPTTLSGHGSQHFISEGDDGGGGWERRRRKVKCMDADASLDDGALPSRQARLC